MMDTRQSDYPFGGGLIRIPLDQGLSRSTVESLRQADWDVAHVYDLAMSQATDRSILDYARLDKRIVVTLNADFHSLLAVANESSPSVIRLRREGLLTGSKSLR